MTLAIGTTCVIGDGDLRGEVALVVFVDPDSGLNLVRVALGGGRHVYDEVADALAGTR